MIVRSFLSWYDDAPMHERIEAVQLMAQCTLAGDIGSDSQQEAESALTLVLDDPAISVRAALAWELALSDKAPRHLVLGLAHDQPEAAALVLARSPQLTDADLIDCARHGEALTHLAIASRTTVSGKVAAALAEYAGSKALIALIDNSGADVAEDTLRTILCRHEQDGSVREALHRREDLPADVRQRLISLVSADLLGFLHGRGWLGDRRAERTVSDARDSATISLAAEADDLARYIAHLAQTGQLTPSLLIRSLLTGDTSLFGAALVCLADVAPNRVAGMLRGKGGSALAATCVRAGLPRPLVPVFTAALNAIFEMPRNFVADGTTLHRPIINRVLAACLLEEGEELRPVLAMLRRLDAELARADARSAIERMKAAEPLLLNAVASALGSVEDGDAFDIEEWHDVNQSERAQPVAEPLMLEGEQAGAVGHSPADAFEQQGIEPYPQLVAVAVPEPQAELAPVLPVATEEPMPASFQRVIRRPATPAGLPADLEALFNEVFRDEDAVQALHVLDGDTARDERYFAATQRREARAA